MIRSPLLPLVLVCVSAACGGCGGSGAAPPGGPGAVLNPAAFRVTEWVAAEELGLVSDLRRGDFAPQAGDEVLVVGERGYWVVAASGEVLRRVAFTYGGRRERVAYGKLIRGAPGSGLRFVAHRGKATCVYGGDGEFVAGRVTGAWTIPAGADLDGDGAEEVVVAEGGRGASVYAGGGARGAMTPVRRLTRGMCSNVVPVVARDAADGGGGRALVAMQVARFGSARDDVVLVDGAGRRRARWPGFGLYGFSALRGADGEIGGWLVMLDPGRRGRRRASPRFVVKDVWGRTVWAVEAPGAEWFVEPRGWRTGEGEDRSMVVLASTTGAGHLFGVYVYGAGGELVYRYVGGEDGQAVMVWEGEGAFREVGTFLVGARGRVWKFEAVRGEETGVGSQGARRRQFHRGAVGYPR